MRFHDSYFFSLLWIIVGLVFFYVYSFKKKSKIIEKFVSPKLKEYLLSNFSPRRPKLKAFIIVLSTALIVIALTRPQWGYHWEEIKRTGVDIMIAVDVSKSMLAKDIDPSRLERAKRKIKDFLKIVKGDRIGLIAFAGVSFLECPLTLDYGTIELFVDELSPDLIPVPGTAISSAINEAVKVLDRSAQKSRALILITDGEDHIGNPIEVAKKASEKSVKIYTIGIGNDEGAPIPEPEGGGFKKDRSGNLVLSKIDETTLQKIALETGGSYVKSVSGDIDLEKIYENIHKTLEEKELKSGRQKRYEERFQYILLLAFILLCVEMMIPERKTKLKFRELQFFKKMFLTLFIASTLLAGPREAGESSYNKGKYSEALQKLLEAQLTSPHDLEIKYNLGNAYYKLGEYDKAAQLFEVAALKGDKILSQKSFYNLGNTAYRMGNLTDSIAYYEKALELNPSDEDAKYNLEFVREELKRRLKESENTKKECQNKSTANKSTANDEKKNELKDGEKEKLEKREGSKKALDESQGKMTKEEANHWLSTLEEDSNKKKERVKGNFRKYQVEKDW